jgi:hypothetical protein
MDFMRKRFYKTGCCDICGVEYEVGHKCDWKHIARKNTAKLAALQRKENRMNGDGCTFGEQLEDGVDLNILCKDD